MTKFWYDFLIRVGLSEYRYNFKGFLNSETMFSIKRQFHAIAMELIAVEAND